MEFKTLYSVLLVFIWIIYHIKFVKAQKNTYWDGNILKQCPVGFIQPDSNKSYCKYNRRLYFAPPGIDDFPFMREYFSFWSLAPGLNGISNDKSRITFYLSTNPLIAGSARIEGIGGPWDTAEYVIFDGSSSASISGSLQVKTLMSFCLWFRVNTLVNLARIFDFSNVCAANGISLFIQGTTTGTLLFRSDINGVSHDFSINNNIINGT